MPHELDQTYRRTFARLKGLFRARGCTPEEAADLAQEAAMRAYVHVRRWGVSGEGLDPLINRIARNLLIDRHRRVVPHLVSLENAAEVSDPAADPTEEVIRRQEAGEVHNAVAELPSRHRAALEYSMKGMTPAEVGDRLGIGRNAADALLHRARRSLRDRLSHIEEGSLGVLLWIRLRVRNAAAKTGFSGSFDSINATSASVGIAATAAMFAALSVIVPSTGFAGLAPAHIHAIHNVAASEVTPARASAYHANASTPQAPSDGFGVQSGIASGSVENSGNRKRVNVHVPAPTGSKHRNLLDATPEVVKQHDNNSVVQGASDQVCYSPAVNCDQPVAQP